MSAFVDLLVTLQSAPRIPTSSGPVIIFDAASTRALDDAMARLDAQMSRDLANLDGFAQHTPGFSTASSPSDGIQKGNTDLEQPGDTRQLWERR